MKHEVVEKVVKICAAFVAYTRKAHDDVLNEQSTNVRKDVSGEKERTKQRGWWWGLQEVQNDESLDERSRRSSAHCFLLPNALVAELTLVPSTGGTFKV